ncbi:MAG: hypothetical protein CUN53_06075 [Phototrophicales bacterium]|nr:MAG: hypothetical protein CUN53_06075 [Phototrophicales bacterium]
MAGLKTNQAWLVKTAVFGSVSQPSLAVGIGVIGQGDSPRSGYGPGITLLMTSMTGGINPVVTSGVNIADIFGLKA